MEADARFGTADCKLKHSRPNGHDVWRVSEPEPAGLSIIRSKLERLFICCRRSSTSELALTGESENPRRHGRLSGLKSFYQQEPVDSVGLTDGWIKRLRSHSQRIPAASIAWNRRARGAELGENVATRQ